MIIVGELGRPIVSDKDYRIVRFAVINKTKVKEEENNDMVVIEIYASDVIRVLYHWSDLPEYSDGVAIIKPLAAWPSYLAEYELRDNTETHTTEIITSELVVEVLYTVFVTVIRFPFAKITEHSDSVTIFPFVQRMPKYPRCWYFISR